MSILQELDDLRSDVASLRRSLKLKDAHLRPLRMRALDEWSNWNRDGDLADQQNDETHGGNIVEDVHTIGFMKGRNRPRSRAWVSAFNRHYGVSYDEFEVIDVEDLSDMFLEVLDIRASVGVMRRWNLLTKETTRLREMILSRCEVVIEQWRSGVDDFLQEDSESLNLYKEIITMYY